MKKRYLIFFLLLATALTVLLSGCGREEQSLDGKNIATFELNGGTLESKTSSIGTKINFAYEPGTFVLDPAELPGYKIYRTGYDFTGWYTDADCNPSSKWDFDSKTIDVEALTLYAGWKLSIVLDYKLYYVDASGNDVLLGSYAVSAGERFEDWRNFATKRDGYTPMGFYSDRDCTTAWDNSFAHPGGDADTTVSVYVSYMEGKWSLVDTYQKLTAALNSGSNIYLMSDLDLGGAALNVSSTYSGVFEGNGYTIKNFIVNKTGTFRNPTCSIFAELGEGADIKNVNFTEVKYSFLEIDANAQACKVSALAKSATGAKITNVSITGTLVTNSDDAFAKLLEAVYEEGSTAEISGFTATITVEKQN